MLDGKIRLSWQDVEERVNHMANAISAGLRTGVIRPNYTGSNREVGLWGIPRGGIHVAQMVLTRLRELHPTPSASKYESPPPFSFYMAPSTASNVMAVVIDDIIDSGATRAQFFRDNPQWVERPFMALVDKQNGDKPGWYVFPWEIEDGKEETGEDNIRRILQIIGEDPNREGLKETPSRVIRSYSEIFKGYKTDPASVIKAFKDGACDEMVILRDIEFYSVCEHHMLPFFGKAHIAYIPNGQVVGISKLARLLEVYSRRLQIQERLTEQITSALMEHLAPKGAACVLEAKHFCMICRGVNKQNSSMVTSSLKGVFLEPAVRQEFMSMVKG